MPEYLQKWGLRNRSQIPSDSEKTTSLSLSHCTSSTSNHTHTLLFAFCRGARVYIFTQPRAAKQTGHTSYTHTGARGGGLQDYIHTQVPEVPECTFSLNPAPPSRLGRLSRPQSMCQNASLSKHFFQISSEFHPNFIRISSDHFGRM